MMPPTKSIKVEVTIARVIGEPLFKAFMDHRQTGESQQSMMQAGAAAIGLMASRLDADELLQTMITVFEYVSCDSKRIGSIDECFVGRNKELWEVFIYALRFNFTDFLRESLFDSILAVKK
jgi:hypothetical protein